MNATNYSKTVSVRMSGTQYKSLARLAKDNHVSMGQFIRNWVYAGCVLKDIRGFKVLLQLLHHQSKSRHTKPKVNPYRVLEKLDEVYPILYRTSSNLNQIARAENSGRMPYIDPEVLHTLKQSLDKTYSIVKGAIK